MTGKTVDIVVVGAHLLDEPLNGQLTDRGGQLVGTVRTAAVYRLHALPTEPPKPGLVRVTSGGAAIEGERWRLPVEGFGSFVAGIPEPLGIATLLLEDGDRCQGFICEAYAVEDAPDITSYGGWRAFLHPVRTDDPSVVADVRRAFDDYEAALVANDLERLDRWFWADERTTRVAFGEAQLGAAAIAAARRTVMRQTPPRTIEHLAVTTFGNDVATVLAVCLLAGGRRVHQSQTWVRLDGAWRVVAAHVSEASATGP